MYFDINGQATIIGFWNAYWAVIYMGYTILITVLSQMLYTSSREVGRTLHRIIAITANSKLQKEVRLLQIYLALGYLNVFASSL